MPHFPKPAEGSWTEHYPELGTEPVSYEDSISPAHYELERDAIFRKTWLNVGRVEQIARKGAHPILQLQFEQFGGPFAREAPLELLREAAPIQRHIWETIDGVITIYCPEDAHEGSDLSDERLAALRRGPPRVLRAPGPLPRRRGGRRRVAAGGLRPHRRHRSRDVDRRAHPRPQAR